MLPMFPKWPIITCGFIAPFLWTGLVYSILGVVSPILDQRIDWLWFTISQCAFGLVAGFVVNLDVKVRTPQFRALPFAVRAGLHADLGGRPEDTNGPE
jgi:flagellar biosynthesis protein FliR